ncbi:MAG: BON domain-containing protein [Acidobacteriota bacterium]
MIRYASALLVVVGLAACSPAPAQSPDVSDSLRTSLDNGGLKDVSVKQDREKGVLTLGGSVTNDADKARADAVAKALDPRDVVANEIKVLPPGMESDAKTISSDVDAAIEKYLHAALTQGGYKDGVDYSVKSGVVTLTGSVQSQGARDAVEKLAAGVPNVAQVVNTLEVAHQRATTTR